MLIIIKTYQQHVGLEAGALQLGGARKRSLEVEEDMHGIPTETSNHRQKCTVTSKKPVKYLPTIDRKSEGKATVNKKCKKMVIQPTRNMRLQR